MDINKIKLFSTIFIFLYHYLIHNGLEKIFCETYFDYNKIKRPLEKCINGTKLSCIGMPSGHAESFSILFLILYYKKLISLELCLLMIFCVSIQRIITKKHTFIQVLAGLIIGFTYFNIYKYFDLSIYSILLIFAIGFVLSLAVIAKIDKEILKPIPSWVSNEMFPNIKKKQEASLNMKILSIYTNSVIQIGTFITWEQVEKYLDIIIQKIKLSGVHYDAIVGIKTGGAILSDYISYKLNLPNYKIKLSRKDYNCNKKEIQSIDDIIKKTLLKDDESFVICEKITDNLEGKNIILIDELVSSGKTMIEAIKYLKNDKKVNTIYPTTISINKNIYKYDVNINYVVDNTIIIWPWGYDN